MLVAGKVLVAMLHHHGDAGSQYTAASTTAVDAVAFSLPPPPTGHISFTSIQQQPPTQLHPVGMTSAFAESPQLDGDGGTANNVQLDDMPADFGMGETGAGASGSGGSTRWPREETLALIRIRSEMDAEFRNAPLKAPLWEDVARKLAALGYRRSAKKCKEKFENVDKYYRRTKEARAGRQDGKSYRFFSELEALHAAAPQRQQQQQATAMSTVQADPYQQSVATMPWTATPAAIAPPGPSLPPGHSFSSMSGSEYDSDSDEDSDEDEESDLGGAEDLGKGDASACDKEMTALIEGMMRQVTEKQDAMERAFLETLERWEAERTAREEAWRRQEVARMNRERERLAKERAAAASRDAALIAFLQRVGGGPSVRLPPPSAVAVPTSPMPDAAPLSPRQDAATTSLQVVPIVPTKSEDAWAWAAAGGESSAGSTSSRWPKEEVQALIQLRMEKDEQCHDTGTKGPLWEDIAAGMRRIGYNRNAKRCKEKWENINKYFKKVKENNKRRPEDSKTCPYFHQLDAMYRKKRFAGRGSSTGSGTAPGTNMSAITASAHAIPSLRELEGKSSNDVGKQNMFAISDMCAAPGNRETAPATTAVGDDAQGKKAEDTATMRETNVQLQSANLDTNGTTGLIAI